VNYAEKRFSNKSYLTIRNEYFNDIKGQRTGYRTNYSEHLIAWGYWLGSTVLFRPELRYKHAYDAPVYNDGTKHSQLVFASDVIFHF
jgi:Putative beta-barrel porin-2, OmpL-like. bbp2